MPKVLVVDDDRSIRDALTTILTTAGFEVVTACDGGDAVIAFQRETPELIIMNVDLPFKDGFTAAVEIRRQKDDMGIPIIFVSPTFKDLSSRIKEMEGEGIDYLILPFEEDELIFKVTAMLRTKERYCRLSKAVEELEESRERFRVMADSSHDLFLLMDFNHNILWANLAWRKHLKCSPGNYNYGKADREIHAEDRGKVLHVWESIKKGGADGISLQYRHRAGGGKYLVLRTVTHRLLVKGKPYLYVAARDITEWAALRQKIGIRHGLEKIVGRDPKMIELINAIRELANVDVPVLIQGESGTGKELVASAIHTEGHRSGKNFVTVNCGALPDTLIESELFGHVKGAFTGAIRDKKGRFELADRGTIFLDEIGDLSQPTQVKLLRVLEEGAFERVGGEQTIHVNVRVISATNKNLEAELKAGRFREDLFYRLNVVPITLPPLRERPDDIPLLIDHILKRKSARIDRRKTDREELRKITISPDVLSLLMTYPWPGNVRELQNVIYYALIKCKGNFIERSHLPPFLVNYPQWRICPRGSRKLSKESLDKALMTTGGNKAKAARKLGVSRATLYRFLAQERKPESQSQRVENLSDMPPRFSNGLPPA